MEGGLLCSSFGFIGALIQFLEIHDLHEDHRSIVLAFVHLVGG